MPAVTARTITVHFGVASIQCDKLIKVLVHDLVLYCSDSVNGQHVQRMVFKEKFQEASQESESELKTRRLK